MGALTTLRHPNIAPVLAIEEDETDQSPVTGRRRGYTLQETIEAAAFPLSTFIDFVEQALDGLIAAHEAGIAHQDIKPENIVLSWGQISRFQVKWQNFCITSSETPEPQSNDLFAFGCVCYFALTQRQPFNNETSEPKPLPQIRPDLPPELCAWVMQLTALDSDSRPVSARSILRDFRRAIESSCTPPADSALSIKVKHPVTPEEPRRHKPTPAPIAARSFSPTSWLSLSKILGNMVGAASF